MFDKFDPDLRYTIMKILSAAYESGQRDDVDMRDVMAVIGLEYTGIDGANLVIDFNSAEFEEEYVVFKEIQLSEVHAIAGSAPVQSFEEESRQEYAYLKSHPNVKIVIH